MNTAELFHALPQAVDSRAYFARLEILDQTSHLLKARLYISHDLFVQAYRNDCFDTTNLALIHAGRRIYARDQIDGDWHRHTVADPQLHDTGAEGRRAVTLSEFLDEVEAVLASLNLP